MAARLEVDRLNPYLVFLFALLSTATLFEGFDAAMMTIAAPDVRATLDISRGEWGVIFAIYRTGMVASFLFLLFADHFGRRTLMMVTIVGFTVFTGLTSLSTSKYEFTFFQFCARTFLTAEYALALIMVSEEFPSRWRGRAIAILASLATVGVVSIAKLQPYILLQEGDPGNWLHDGGLAVVTVLQQWVGRPTDGVSWRVLYLLGLAPLGLIFLLRLGMRETRRFVAVREEAPKAPVSSLQTHLDNARTPWRPEYRQRTGIVVLLWNCVHLVTAPAVAFWVIYAREDLGFSPALVGDIIFWAYVGGVVGHLAAGQLIDTLGRKWTCAIFYALASVCITGLFQTTTMFGQYFWHITCVFCFSAAGTATNVFASELYPTAIRATGYGWTTNLFGRATEILTPLAVATFITALGISWSVTIVAFGPLLGAVLVLLYAPETKGLTLEEIQEELGDGAEAPTRSGEVAAASGR